MLVGGELGQQLVLHLRKGGKLRGRENCRCAGSQALAVLRGFDHVLLGQTTVLGIHQHAEVRSPACGLRATCRGFLLIQLALLGKSADQLFGLRLRQKTVVGQPAAQLNDLESRSPMLLRNWLNASMSFARQQGQVFLAVVDVGGAP